MLTELFVSNLASTTVVSGGMSSNATSGQVETVTVEESDGIFPVVRPGYEQFHFKDRNPSSGSEIFACIETDGSRWTVIRGAENTLPQTHGRKFTIRQVITSEFLKRLGAGSTTELGNLVTGFNADPTGDKLADDAFAEALYSGPVYLPTGVYRISRPINLIPGNTIISFGHAVIKPTNDFEGDCAVELVSGSAQTRLENVTLDGSDLGAGTDVYGIFGETRRLDAEIRNVRITGFPNSGMILSGTSLMLDRINCSNNFGSGFELNISDSLLFACRAFGNYRYGFIGDYQNQQIGCVARDNKLGDFRCVG